MKRTLILCFLGCLLALSARAQYRNAPSTVDREKMVRLVNEVRAKGCRCGGQRMAPAEPVRWNATLEQAAQSHSDWMLARNRFSHRGQGGSSTGDRVEGLGYAWSHVGENIAAGQVSEAAVMESWLTSEGHCKNLMNPRFTEMGVATAGPYWTQVFARPRGQ